MDAAARLGRGHALHAVHAALVLHPAVDAAPFDGRDDFLEPARAALAGGHHLDAPSLFLGEAAVHPEQIRGEERRLVAAGTRADFEDDVLLVVRILRNEEDLEILQQRLAPHLERLQLLARQIAHVGIVAVDELLGARDVLFDAPVLAELLHERLELGERLRRAAVFGRVGLHLRRAELGHQLVVLVLDAQQLVEHHQIVRTVRLERVERLILPIQAA